jgi:threonylcarbamoyladenosine tRNA methylthiotransferase MtaB
MPQVARPIVKERARRLRDKGAAALRRHLDREIGKHRQVLTESGDGGHTEHFTPVRLRAPAEPGMILPLTMIGHDGQRLLAA